MANGVKKLETIDLLNHPDNIRPTLSQLGETRPKKNPRIRFVEPKFDVIKRENFRIFGEEAHRFAEKGKFDHLREQYHDYRSTNKMHQDSLTRSFSSLTRNSSSPMAKILQPDLSPIPCTTRPSSPCLRGEESLENWRRGRGCLSLQYHTPQRVPTSDAPSCDSRFSYRTEEVLHSLNTIL
ncbi:unnamed protein product [Rodentolepis nana]|uniref:Uncharacterized protein n=1 Tax=Rodentolepis nana TaxID=102285 RepID=A0A0R3TTH8_RODNA|nr:unnamed protein product [Rodentolepis nana]